MQFGWTHKGGFSLDASSDLLIYRDLFLPITHITHLILFVKAISNTSGSTERPVLAVDAANENTV